MLERAGCRLGASVYLMSNRTALHEDDRMVAVLACDGCRQANHESGFGLAYHLLDTVRRQVMALIDDHLAVLSDAVIHDTFSDETLNDADINLSSRAISSSAMRPIDFAGTSRNVERRSIHWSSSCRR